MHDFNVVQLPTRQIDGHCSRWQHSAQAIELCCRRRRLLRRCWRCHYTHTHTHTHTHCSRSHRSGSSSEQPRCLYVSHARSRIKRNGKRQSERGNDSQSFVCQQLRNHRHHRRHRHPLVLRLLLELNPEASFNALFIQGERERERERERECSCPKGHFPLSPLSSLPCLCAAAATW